MPRKTLNLDQDKIVVSKEQLELMRRREPEKITLIEASKDERYVGFKRIKIENERSNYVVCETCVDKPLIYYNTSTGNANLTKHIEIYHGSTSSKEDNSKQTTMDMFSYQKVTAKDKYEVAEKIAILCAREFRPYCIATGQGFIDFTQSVIKIANVRGNVSAKELLPSKQTVKDHMTKMSTRISDKLVDHFKDVAGFNCTTDHWLETKSGQSYLTVTVQYYHIENDRMYSRVIGTTAVEDKTAVITGVVFFDTLKKFHIEGKLRLIVSDNASALKLAFKNYDWIACASHNLALVHKYAHGYEGSNKNPVPNIRLVIETAKEIVTMVKKSGINKEFNPRLKQECDTRWDSIFDMLDSVHKNFKKLESMSALKSKMNKINYGLLTELRNLLEPLKHFRLGLSSENSPTFGYVAVAYQAMMEDICVAKDNDHELIIVLKSRYRQALKDKFNVDPLHIVASFLTPKSRNFTFSDKKLAKLAEEKLNELVVEVPESDPEDRSQNVQPENRNSIFDKYMQIPTVDIHGESEINRYKRAMLSADDLNMNPLTFWKINMISYPRLSEIALWLLSAPATNNSSERSFSAAGNLITDARNRLKPVTASDTLNVRSNYDLA